ncbi:MAG: LysM peptidoglycan-binding domain-containing protein [Nibricoccus sp.]
MAALIFVAGCERADVAAFTVEGDEPGYRRGKDLIKQGRNQEALSEFLKVIDKRGLDNAPESHLEVGLLYQFHIKNPIAAIYHYQKFRELKPNSPQADLVRQRIDAATRDFAKAVLGNSLDKDLDRLTTDELAKQLRLENDRLKTEIASLRAGKIVASRDAETAATEETPAQAAPTRPATVANNEESPVQRAAIEPEVSPVAPVAPVPTPRPTAPAQAQTRPPTPSSNTTRPGTTASSTTTRPSTSYRRHVVAKGDTLYSLSTKYYGNPSRWRDIYAANRDVMRNTDDYKIGMVLKIPQ